MTKMIRTKASLIEFFSMQTWIQIRRGRVVGGGGGGGSVWHQGFVIEQDILISVELISIQQAAVPS